MKSVRNRLLVLICLFIFVILITVGGVTVFLNSWTTNSLLEQSMSATVKVAADRVYYHIRSYQAVAEAAGRDSVIADPNAAPEDKQASLDASIAMYPDITRGNILDVNGISIFTGQDFSDRDYYQHSIKGELWVSDPLVSKVTGAITIIISAPIYHNDNIVGVVYLVPVETFLNDIVGSIKLSPGGSAVVISRNGIVVAHPSMDFVANYHNTQELAKKDSSYKELAELERRMTQGSSGFGTYTLGGVKKVMAYAPVPGNNGWSIHVNCPRGDFTSYTITSIIVTAVLLVVTLIAAVFIVLSLANGIGTPLKVLSSELAEMASTGKIHLDDRARAATNRYAEKKDEIGGIAHAVNGLIDMLASNSSALETIADGDLTVKVNSRSPEDTLGNALNKMLSNLNNMFTKINSSSIQVAEGSKQIADGSQLLAQGSTEQAAAIEQISSSISEVTKKTQENADLASKAASLADAIKSSAEKGNQQMNNMMQAVREINDAGQSISKVMKVIDDIASQTNILALNAAVEAARAGQHGKGFAVVAEEVRSLASKSAEAAKDTGNLIANSIEKSELGTQIAKETAESLIEIVSGINESSSIVSEIAASSNEQARAVSQINRGVDQVANVVHQNSATAEQSAAASAEMSEQSVLLEELMSQFKLESNISGKRAPKMLPHNIAKTI